MCGEWGALKASSDRGTLSPGTRGYLGKHIENSVAAQEDAILLSLTGETMQTKRNLKIPTRSVLQKASSAGLAVGLAMVTEAIEFSFVAGVLFGLWTTVVLGFTAAALGGRPGICSSASGACSVVVAALCTSHGPAYLSAFSMMVGVMQIVGGYLGVGKLVKLVPIPVMMGFVNDLALVMTKAQLVHFQMSAGSFLHLTSPMELATNGIAALTMALVHLLPKITKAFPPTLGAVTIASIVSKILSIPAKTLADVAGASTFAGGFAVLPKKLDSPMCPLRPTLFTLYFPTLPLWHLLEFLKVFRLCNYWTT